MMNDSSLIAGLEQMTREIPLKSIVICGSRATGQGVSESSDYDIVVVMNTLLIPLYLRKLKQFEKRLSRSLDLNININPLPTFRVRRAKGNLFLYKLKKEGNVLYGQDVIRSLDTGSVSDIGEDWYFSYFFSALQILAQNFEPQFLVTAPDKEQSGRIIRDAAKAIYYCGELHLLRSGYYATQADELLSRIGQLELKFTRCPQLLERLRLAVIIREGNMEAAPDSLEFWFQARRCLLDTFRLLVEYRHNPAGEGIEEMGAEYLGKREGDQLKNLQYFVLALMVKKALFMRSLVTRHSIEDKFRVALLWLMLSIDRQGVINERLLDRARRVLKGYTKIGQRNSNTAGWEEVRGEITTYSTFAWTVMGV